MASFLKTEWAKSELSARTETWSTNPGFRADRGFFAPLKTLTTPEQTFFAVTLLFQDANGGLEVENSAGDFVRVPVLRAPDGTLAILVQAADLLERQTSGRLISAVSLGTEN